MTATDTQAPKAPLDRMAAEIDAGDLERAMKTYDALPPEVQAHPRAQILMATAFLKIGEIERARASLRAAEAVGKMGQTAKIERVAVLAKLDEPATYHAALLEICELLPESTRHQVALCQSHLAMGKPDAAAEVLDRVEASGKGDSKVRPLRYQIALARLDVRGMIEALDAILLKDDTLPQLPQLMFTLRELPEPDRSRLYTAFQTKWPDISAKLERWGDRAHRIGEIRPKKSKNNWSKAPEAVPRPDLFQRPLVEDDDGDVVESPKGGSGTTLLVFTGFADGAMVRTEWIDAFCAARNHSAIYLRDFSRTLYMNGVPSLGDNLDAAVEGVARLLESHGTQRLLCLGTSAGGFGAIRYGLRLKAARIMAVSPPVSFRVVDEFGDSRARMFVQRMYSLFGKEEDLDLSRDVAAAGGHSRLDVWFGAQSRTDAAHAQMLDGLPGVTLHPLEGNSEHTVFPDIIENGGFEAFLDG